MCPTADRLHAACAAANAACKTATGKERARLAQAVRDILSEYAAHQEACEECKKKLGLNEGDKKHDKSLLR